MLSVFNYLYFIRFEGLNTADSYIFISLYFAEIVCMMHFEAFLVFKAAWVWKCLTVLVVSFFALFSCFYPPSGSEVWLWGNQRRPPWAGRSRTPSTTQSLQTGWPPWPWPPAVWPLPTASGPAPQGPPAPTGSQTERCPFRRGGVSPGSPPSRPNECPSRMLMWAGRRSRNDAPSWSCTYWCFYLLISCRTLCSSISTGWIKKLGRRVFVHIPVHEELLNF